MRVVALASIVLLAGCTLPPSGEESDPAVVESASADVPSGVVYQRTRSFTTSSADLDDPFHAPAASRGLTLEGSDLTTGTRASLRLTLVDPSGREHGECRMGATRGDGGSGSCTVGGGGGWPDGRWHVRYQPDGPLTVTVRVTQG